MSCNSLVNLDLSSFNTSKVTNMSSMFDGCTSLKELDLFNFNTSKVIRMSNMFYECKNLKTIYVSDLWDMSNVTNSENMFRYCRLLTGAVPFDSTKTDATMANYTTGYLTYKKNTN